MCTVFNLTVSLQQGVIISHFLDEKIEVQRS